MCSKQAYSQLLVWSLLHHSATAHEVVAIVLTLQTTLEQIRNYREVAEENLTVTTQKITEAETKSEQVSFLLHLV